MATQVARSFEQSILLAVVAAEVAVLSGTTISYGVGTAASGTIVLVAIGVHLLAAGARTAGLSMIE